jgi:hypothetical protein
VRHYAGVLKEHVQSGQFRLGLLRKRLDALVAAQVELPGFRDGLGAVRASSSASVLRPAMMTLEAPRRAMCLAASRPRPVFAPVTMTVLPT